MVSLHSPAYFRSCPLCPRLLFKPMHPHVIAVALVLWNVQALLRLGFTQALCKHWPASASLIGLLADITPCSQELCAIWPVSAAGWMLSPQPEWALMHVHAPIKALL